MNRNTRRAIACVAVAVAAVTLLTATTVDRPKSFNKPNLAGAAVKITLEKGYGSGIHVGGGFILSSAHVVDDNATVTVVTDTKEIQKADVLWATKTYDVALLRVAKYDRIEVSPLACDVEPKRGDTIRADGNPLRMDTVSTWGRVGGNAREHGPWKSVIVTDMTLLPGMSGGGVFDAKNRLIGITVGLALWGPNPMNSAASGLSFVVPASVLCLLTGRG